MSTPTTHETGHQATRGKNRSWFSWGWKIGVVALCGILAMVFFGGSAETRVDGATFEARRGPLRITVVEGGEIESQEAQQIRSEVQGQTQIIYIVDEGYRVTREDIENELVLVELDSSDLYERSTQQEIQYQNAAAALTDAEEQYEIQVKQNESDIREAQLRVLFARMDFEKYLGTELGLYVLDRIGLDAQSVADLLDEDNDRELSDYAERRRDTINLATLVSDARLGGEAQQRRRTLESDITLAQEELKQAETRHDWTQRLSEQGFVTAAEEEQDRMTVQRREVQLQSAITAEELFLQYEFAKQVESLVSDYEEAISQLERTRRQAASRIAQREAQLRSSQATYDLQSSRRDELLEQIENCIITAEREGIVVYASSTGNHRGDPIEEGTMVRERQDILMIPDMNKMAVRVRIHESSVNRIRPGQRTFIQADSYPEEVLRGEVHRVAMLPDSTHRWMNPDLRVFATVVRIDGSYEWLRPGMSAQAEILVSQYDDVVYVPIQAVTALGNDRVVYVTQGGNAEPRVVEVGEYNDRFIHIMSGLEEGEEVLLRPPRPDTDASRMDDGLGFDDVDMDQLEEQPEMDQPMGEQQPAMPGGEGRMPGGGGGGAGRGGVS